MQRTPSAAGWAPSWGVAGVMLGVYVVTAAPGLVWGDGIELAAVCASLGIAHPTGYPLFTLLGHLFTYLPVGEIPFRVTLMCAVAMALSVACMEQLLARWLSCLGSRGCRLSDGRRRAASVAGALAFAGCLGPWTHATRTEVYGLQLLIQSLVVLSAWHLLTGDDAAKPSPLRAWGVSLLMGLGLAHHLLTVVLIPLWLAVLWRHARGASGNRRELWGHGIALCLGLLPILYLPLRAQQHPAVSWGHPADLEGLLWTLKGGDFPSELFLVESSGETFTFGSFVAHGTARSAALANYLLGMVMPSAGLPSALRWAAWVVAGLGLLRGGVLLWFRGRAFAGPWAAGLGLYLGVLLSYNIGDITDYQLGLFALLWPVVWWGAWDLVLTSWSPSPTESGGGQDDPGQSMSSPGMAGKALRLLMNARLPTRSSALVVGLALLVLPVALLAGNFAVADRSDDRLVDQFAERLLVDLPPNAILLTQGDFSTATAWYRQAVLGERPDVLVFCLDFFYDPWYGRQMARRDLAGRRVGISDAGGEWGESFLDALDRLIVAPNPETPVLIMPSPRQARALHRRFEVRRLLTLLDADDLAAYDRRGWRAPQPMVFQIRSRPTPQSP